MPGIYCAVSKAAWRAGNTPLGRFRPVLMGGPGSRGLCTLRFPYTSPTTTFLDLAPSIQHPEMALSQSMFPWNVQEDATSGCGDVRV